MVGTGRSGGRLTNTALDHYCTSYRQSYNKELFQPCLGYHSGTGYRANYRPVLYYSSNLDCCDNPQFGLSLLDSFESHFKRHYRCLVLPDGTETLGCSGSRPRESGYLQLNTDPRPRTVSCQTEYKGCHVPHRLRCLIGRREESGYTEGSSLQPNTFLPQHINMDDARKTQESVMRTDFLSGSSLQGSEALPRLVPRVSRDTGFTRDTQKPLTTSASLQMNSSRQKIRSPAVRFSVGPMTTSGCVLNTPNITRLSHTPDEPQHFLTHYQSKFCGRSAVEQRRADWMTGGVQIHRDSGYSERDTSRFHLGFNTLDLQ